jgi:hypothetical protein
MGTARGKLAAWMRGDGDGVRLPWRMFWVAFAVRVLYMTLAHTFRMRLVWDHFEFGWEMGRIARALATGYGYADPFNGHSGPTAWCPPLYPLILAGVFKIFGIYTMKSSWVILTINSVFSALAAPAVYEIALRCFKHDAKGLKIALWSGWLWALYPAAMQYAVKWIWEMSLTVCLFAWVIVLALRIRGIGAEPGEETQTPRRWAAFGAGWGMIALTNSSLLTFLPFCAFWMLWDQRYGRIGIALRNAVLSGVCFVAVVSPWVVRNWYAFHAFVPMRANFGAELYESAQLANQGFPWMATLPMAPNTPQFQHYIHVGEVVYSKERGEEAKAIIRTHRKLFLEHAVLRVYFFWNSVPHPVEKSLANELAREAQYGFLSLSGLFGLALALRRRVPGSWLFFWAFAITPLIYYFVTVQARFRHPLEPLICVLSVYLFQSADKTRTWSWQAKAKAEM